MLLINYILTCRKRPACGLACKQEVQKKRFKSVTHIFNDKGNVY